MAAWKLMVCAPQVGSAAPASPEDSGRPQGALASRSVELVRGALGPTPCKQHKNPYTSRQQERAGVSTGDRVVPTGKRGLRHGHASNILYEQWAH